MTRQVPVSSFFSDESIEHYIVIKELARWVPRFFASAQNDKSAFRMTSDELLRMTHEKALKMTSTWLNRHQLTFDLACGT